MESITRSRTPRENGVDHHARKPVFLPAERRLFHHRGGDHHIIGRGEFPPPPRPGRDPYCQHGRCGRQGVGDHILLSDMHVSARSVQFPAIPNLGGSAFRAGDRDRVRLHRNRFAFLCHPEVRRCGKDVLSQHPDRIRFPSSLAHSVRTLHYPVCASKENILIVGTGEVARQVGEEVRKRKRLGFHLVGFINAPPANE